MYPQNGTNIDLTLTSASDTISVDNTEDYLVSIRAPIDTDKPYYHPDTYTSYSSSYTPRTSSKSALSPSAQLPTALTSSSKSYNRIGSMQDGVQKMRLEYEDS